MSNSDEENVIAYESPKKQVHMTQNKFKVPPIIKEHLQSQRIGKRNITQKVDVSDSDSLDDF